MGELGGFLRLECVGPRKREPNERINDYKQYFAWADEKTLRDQGARCMDCGIPFCQSGCPLGNLIPEWNDLVYRGRWREAIDRLHATNNFPEFTGKLCPAPCETSCVLSINSDPVSIKQIELSIIDRAFQEGWVVAQPPSFRTGKTVAVVGSGPAGLAAAQQLNRAGHRVTVLERDDRTGGLLRYGIPDFKMDKALLDRRLHLLEEEGIVFRVNTDVGVNLTADHLLSAFDAVVLTNGATKPRDIPVPGRELNGVHFAMEYLTLQNRRLAGDAVPDDQFITAKGKRVVILGGGDTGADCLGTAHRQGAESVMQFQRWPEPPTTRPVHNPWPAWPEIFRLSNAHEEGGQLEFAVLTREFVGRYGKVEALRASRASVTQDVLGRPALTETAGTEYELAVDLVLLAIGYTGPDPNGIVAQLSLDMTKRGTIATDAEQMTSRSGIFAAGDASHGQSLIVTAIADGRKVARSIDRYLMGTTMLP